MPVTENIEKLSREEIEQLQIERLQTTLNRVYRNVAHYQSAFDEADVDLEKIKSISALRLLPFTTREDLAKSYPYGMYSVPLREIVRIHSAFGASGAPIAVGYTRNDLRNWTECTSRLLAWAGVNANDVVQIALPYSLLTGEYGFHQGAEHIGASVIPSAATPRVEKQVTIMRDYKTTALVCTPGYAQRIAHALKEMGLHPEALHLRIAMLGGEPWSDAARAEIERDLHVVTLDHYGLSDAMGPGVAGECPEHDGLHLNADHFIVEVVAPKTLEPVKPGESGELVVTTITREGFPLIRYRTGDVASVQAAPCRCGRTLPRITRVLKRCDDRFCINGVCVFPALIEEILGSEDVAAKHHQIIIDRHEGLDALEVKVEVSEATPSFDEVRQLEKLRERIAARIETVLDVHPRITLVESRSLQEGGLRKVVDRRAD